MAFPIVLDKLFMKNPIPKTLFFDMSNSEICTTLLHLRDTDDHNDQKLILYADFNIHLRNLADATGSVRISEFEIKT